MTREDPELRTTREQAENLRQMLDHVIVQARSDAERIEDACAKALFETTAEVLGGLDRAFARYIDRGASGSRDRR